MECENHILETIMWDAESKNLNLLSNYKFRELLISLLPFDRFRR